MTECDTGIVCEVLRVSRSAYYRVSKTKESEEIELEKAVINCFEKHNGNYGRIRIKKEMARKGLKLSENKISRILKEHGLVAKSGRSGRKKAAKPTEEQYIQENLIKGKFEISEPNYLWCSDITELVCKGSKVYVCGVIDVATRRLVGWAIKRHQRQEIVQEAFEMAVGRNPKRLWALCITATEGVNIQPNEQRSLLSNTDLERACRAPARRATISQSRAFGEPSNVRCLISGISHSRNQAEF